MEPKKLTDFQKKLLVGLLLGDGHLETRTQGKTYRLKVTHSEKQLEYLDWLFCQFREWIPALATTKRMRTDGRVSYEFSTSSSDVFQNIAKQFYITGKKVIPVRIENLLSPEALAVWFMDDGSSKSSRHKTFIIHTLGYKKSDLMRMQDVLISKFQIETKLHKQRNNTFRLYVTSKSALAFFNLVYPTIKSIPSMLYKLENNMPKK